MKDLGEYRARKEGRVTPKLITENVLAEVDRGEIESVVTVARYRDGVVRTGWSTVRSTEAVGMLQIGISDLIDDMRELEE